MDEIFINLIKILLNHNLLKYNQKKFKQPKYLKG